MCVERLIEEENNMESIESYLAQDLHIAARQIVARLAQHGFTAYYAGGCVRDMLLGRTAKDIDIATSARPEEVQKLFTQASDLQGKVFGVVRIKEGEHVFEVATFRTDGPYLDGRHPSHVSFATDKEDAERRDFTINGLFYDPLQKRIIDYVEGERDLKAKVIRAIGDPRKRFSEDFLRILRAIRFAAEFDFQIESNTWEALVELAPQTRHLAIERVRDELNKALTSSDPQRAFDLLDSSGLFAIWIPEILAFKGVEQPPQFHPEGDVYTHVRMMMGYLKKPSIEMVWSVLLHDIAKPATFKIDETGRIRFNEHETIGARMAHQILRRLRFSNDQIDAITTCVAGHMAFKDAPKMKLSTLKRFLARPHFDLELGMHRIDCLCSSGDVSIHDFLVQKREELGQEVIKPKPLLSGHDIISLGVQEGRHIGEILRKIEEEQLEGKLQTHQQAIERAKEMIESSSA